MNKGRLLLIAYLVLVTLWPMPLWAATYFVATTGNDTTGDGSSGTPWLTIQKCVDEAAAGDTCSVNDGTYNPAGANTSTVALSGVGVANGSAGNYITLKATNRGGATITVPSQASRNAAIFVGKAYWIIDGFVMTGGTSTSASASHHGIFFENADNIIVRYTHIHTVGRVCSQSGFGFVGMTMETSNSNIVLDYNLIHNIGRHRNGESGCSTALFQNDHGLYFKNVTNVTVRNNIIYDTNRGFPLHFFGGTVDGAYVYNNTMADKSPTGSPAGQVMLGSTLSNADFRNNIFYDPPTSVFTTFSLTPTNIDYDYNLTDSTDANMFVSTVPANTVDGGHNLTSTAPGFTDAGSRDYTILTSSAAKDAGVDLTSSGVTDDFIGTSRPQNSVYDIGAYEFLPSGGGAEGGQSQSPTTDSPRQPRFGRSL